MAWISVDQKLIGGKLRSLYKAIGCSQNEAIGTLISLWLWGIDNAEADGLMMSADREDIKQSFQSGLSKNLDADMVMDCLIDSGWIDEVDGQLYLHDWGEWRAYYNRYINDKKGNRERQARFKAKHRDSEWDSKSNAIDNVTDNVTENNQDQVEQPDNQEHSGEKPPERKPESKYGPEFEEFWKIYPRKVDKGEGFKKYKARIKDGYSPEELKQAAKAYSEECKREGTEQKFIKYAKTFLGPSLPFTEYIPKKQEPAPVQAQTPASGIRSM